LPKKTFAPPLKQKKKKKKSNCDCPKKKKKCGCNDDDDDANATPPKCGGKGEPKCVTPPVLCEDPGTPMHSVRLGQTYTEGSKLQFLCQPPYRLVGDEFRTCSSEKRKSNKPTGDGNGGWRRAGDWSGTQPTCVPPTCPKVDTINDGIVIGTDFRFPGNIEFKCNVGYTIEVTKTLQCLGTAQWNGTSPACYPLQKPSAALTEEFDKSKAEANELAKELGLEVAKERDPTPEETEEEEQKKEEEAETAINEKSKETIHSQNDKAALEKKEKQAKITAMEREKLPENVPGSIEQLAHVARHAQIELKRAEANRKDVEALVLANSASTSMAEAYGNTANLLSGDDPLATEKAATKRAEIISNLLNDGSPLYRDGNQADQSISNKETRGRDAASVASNIGSQFAASLLDQLLASQPKNPETIEQDKAEREQIITRATTAATKAGYAEGTKEGVEDEASAIRLGKIAGAKAAADVMSPVLNLSPTEILKNNEGMLEKDLRKSIALPSTPSDLVSSSEKAATDAKIKTTQDIELKRKKM